MGLGGLGMSAANALRRKPLRKCERCGLYYVANENDRCEHCADLDSRGLQALLEKTEEERLAHHRLGKWFFAAAIVILLLLMGMT